MKKKTKIVIASVSVILVVGFLWPAFQPMTPDYYGRIMCVSVVKQYLEEQKNPLEDLRTIVHLGGTIEIAKEGVLPEPTKKINVIVFNKDYLKKDSQDWILIVLGRDWESYAHGDLVLMKNLERKQVRNARRMIHNQDGLVCYYLYLRGEPNVPSEPNIAK
jgi:hypothetical protein